MGLKIYEVWSWSVPETQEAQDRLFEQKRASGEWSEDVLLDVGMPKIEKERIEDAVEAATGGQEWNLKLSPVDLHGQLDLPLVYEAYGDQLDTAQSDFLGDYVMTEKMLNVILSADVQATSYPVAILDRQRIQQLAASRPEGVSPADVDGLVQDFRSTATARYYFLHLLTEEALFDPEQSDRGEKRYVLTQDQPGLPPFFRVAWGPRSALLCTAEGRAQLESAGLLGLHFIEVETQAPITT
ncbi:hypothetical protein [Deinococcus sp. RM]|uniref:hypothetical protein n=1 Tax=Deinococcus sp. RM TaxID=2316359 RepID=UPI000E681750|nr:hypothetical protein [Deinococcus sp. RM]RIY01730.1 hypothetical protein D3W47_15230 [Deinococcus sp. RM]